MLSNKGVFCHVIMPPTDGGKKVSRGRWLLRLKVKILATLWPSVNSFPLLLKENVTVNFLNN